MKKEEMDNINHESGKLHVTGEAIYIDDIQVSDQLLNGYLYTSPHAHAKIKSFDLEAAKTVNGVHAVLSYKDIPGHNQMGPVFHDEPVLAEGLVEFIGQTIFIIAAETQEAADEAKKLINIEYELLEPILTIEEAIEKNSLLQPERKIESGDIESGFKKSSHIIEGEFQSGGQEHWYLETQICLCVPGEGNEIKAFSSTQHPSETQAIISEVLGIGKNEIEVECRRLGGGFGGKETSGNHVAAWASILAVKTGRPVKIRLFRDEDQKITGKRHPYLYKYKVGFDNNGKIIAAEIQHFANGGFATDLSMAILERGMLHAENTYYIPNIRIVAKAMKTNLPSNVAFRGFGAPQGILCIEEITNRISFILKKDAAEIKFNNFYGIEDNNLAPYGAKIENNRMLIIYNQLLKSADYKCRKNEISDFNKQNEFYKKGLAITPVKFGISFTTAFLNQAGALINIYNDGTISVNHGGVEMGQGLYTKIKKIAAAELGVSIKRIKVTATNTSKVPNTSATAASSGTDLNGMAVKDGIDTLKSRLAVFAAAQLMELFNKSAKTENIVFENDCVFDSNFPEQCIKFDNLIAKAYLNQIGLSAVGFYKTPDIYFDRATGKGKPFHYYAFGMAVCEVLVDTLTGRTKVLRADILHDVGESIIPNIDKGQVEGAFVQGLGWVTSEDMKYDKNGNLLNHSPDTYKIPTIQDIPEDFRVELLKGYPNPGTIRLSKAVGEPPFVLALSAWFAIKDAISAISNHAKEPNLKLPATNENILLAIEEMK
ncbi:MAG TPA: xanthine dehydrogenase molybdopterin binding subunit [Bacteroidales bacterium]|nr:xanthine dehydrogenase molybdopterin binding subunit [Bacteroidales bacterium]